MRNPTDETLARQPDAGSSSPAARGKGGKVGRPTSTDAGTVGKSGGGDPHRRCILAGESSPRDGLVRLALAPDGSVHPDVRAKAPGRGAWIGVTKAELVVAIKKGKLKGGLARAYKTADFTIPADLPEMIDAALMRNAMDRLGLESRGGTLLTGSDKIEGAARSGKLHALYHASDAGTDGNRKLDQAWRIGNDVEGSALRGLALPIPRPTLSLALGRENVVHIGLTDRAAAKRVSDALGRWLHFIGPEPGSHQSDALMESPSPMPCETVSQGASASGLSGPGMAARLNEETE